MINRTATLLFIAAVHCAVSAADQKATPQVCGNNAAAKELAEHIIKHPSQKREVLRCNTQLAQIAQKRAKQLAKNQADPEVTANQVVMRGGFRFPDYYPVSGNQVEAVARAYATADEAIKYLVNSGKHHDHVLGKGDFFEIQTEIGVGFYAADDAVSHDQWVVLIAQPWQAPEIVYTQKFAEPIIRGPEKCNDKKLLRKSPELKEQCRLIAKKSKKKQ